MNDNLNALIKSLSDHEFAVFIGHQNEGMLPYAKKKILAEIELRSLTKSQMENYFNTRLVYQNEGPFCEKCGSNKFFEDIDLEYQNGDHFTHEIDVRTNRCRLCNFNPSKAEEKNIFKRIKRYFFDPNKIEKTIKSYDWFGH